MTAQRQFWADDFDGPGRVHRDAHDTESEAAEAFPEIKGEQRLAVLRAFVAAGDEGLTDHECHIICGMRRPHIAGTRREELMAAGVPIVKTDQRRPTDTGARAIVWAWDARHSRAGNGAVITSPRHPLEEYSRVEALRELREEGSRLK